MSCKHRDLETTQEVEILDGKQYTVTRKHCTKCGTLVSQERMRSG